MISRFLLTLVFLLGGVSIVLGKEIAGGFTRMDPSQAGIDFRNLWTPDTDLARSQFDTAFTGGGVALGDYNGDGLPDLFLTRAFGGNRLYQNLGDWNFREVTKEAGLVAELANDSWGTGPCFVDVDNDGLLDLFVCSNGKANRLYLNQGEGRFFECAKEWGLDYSGASISAAFADYDRDGDLDLYLVTNRKPSMTPPATFDLRMRKGRLRVPEEWEEVHDVVETPYGPQLVLAGQYDYLLRNEGNRFVDVTSEALGDAASENYQGLAARWWDYNGDLFPDLYVSNDFWGPDQFFKNNGDGTFTDVAKTALPYQPWFSMGSDAADINNDGLLDFMAADMAATTHYKAKLNMGDMDKNNWFLASSNPRQFMANCLFLNTGTERFQEISSIAGVSQTDWTWALKFADFDRDGQIDLYVTNGMTRNWFNGDKVGRDDGSSKTEPFAWLKRWQDEPLLNENNLAFRNRGNLKFEKVGPAWGLDHLGVSFGSAVGDLDGDGDLDLVTINFGEEPHLYSNNLPEKDWVSFSLRGEESNRFGIGALVTVKTADGIQVRDLATTRGFMSADDPVAHFGLGEQGEIESVTIRWPSGVVQSLKGVAKNRHHFVEEVGEKVPGVNLPKSEPLFIAVESFPSVKHEEGTFNDFEREPLLPNKMSQWGPGLAVGDVNGDGLEDVYLPGAAGQPGQLVLQVEAGKWDVDERAGFTFSMKEESEQLGAVFFDADGDGDLDLYVSSGGVEHAPTFWTYDDILYLNDGKGRFTASPEDMLPPFRQSSGMVAVADYDRDGDLDLFVGGRSVPGAYPMGPQSTLLRNDSGKFTTVLAEEIEGLERIGMVTSALWSDANDDGWIDLFVTTEWGAVSLWLNEEGQLVNRTEEAGLSNYLGWWNGIASGDFDNDGDRDYAVTNFGQNTKYHPTREEPVVLFYGDVDGSGGKAILEAKYDDECLWPVRGRSCSTAAIPSLGKKFGSFSQFASASLTEIYDETKLEAAMRLEANTLSSSILWNEGEARFRVEPMPSIAQVSPGFGIVANDFDGDGNEDLAFVQNFSHPQPETRRMNSGLGQVLLGDGKRGFSALRADQSGLKISGDARGLALLDLNGDARPDLLATQNDGPLCGLTSSGSGSFIKLTLKGLPGNPTAIGAKVRLEFESKAHQEKEVSAGGSYLSQESSGLFFSIPKGSRPTRWRVRWPNGEERVYAFESEEKFVNLDCQDGG